MNEKEQILRMLREELKRWRGILDGMSEEELTMAREDGGMPLKDEVAHLWAWQRITRERLEAAIANREPDFSMFPAELAATLEEDDVERINAWIYETNRERAWEDVYDAWHKQFSRIIELAEAMPAKVLTDRGRYGWNRGYSIADTLRFSWEHHHEEHLGPLLARQDAGLPRQSSGSSEESTD
jgi:hypothetical protein